ncbi:MAG: hypothetical protein WAZ60_23800 [Desulfosalsimonadaceae bacterium]
MSLWTAFMPSRKPITPEAAKEAILRLSEPRRMAVISELVKVASRGRAHIHANPKKQKYIVGVDFAEGRTCIVGQNLPNPYLSGVDE